MSQYFPKPYETFGGDINVKVDLSNYAMKSDNKNVTHVDTSSLFQIKLLILVRKNRLQCQNYWNRG